LIPDFFFTVVQTNPLPSQKLGKLQKWWNTIHCTSRNKKYKNV